MRPLLKRSTIITVGLAATLAVGVAPAAAIVGGHDATTTYPGLAAVSVLIPGVGTAHCGGALLAPPLARSSRFVLTAAHCVSDDAAAPQPVPSPAGNITVRVGSADRSVGGIEATGVRVYLHPDWMWGVNWPATPVSDLAVVELNRDILLPALPIAGQQVEDGGPVRLVGWGLTIFPPTSADPLPKILQELDTTRLPATDCTGGFIGTGEICTNDGACFGDSGSPALRQVTGLQPGTRSPWASVGLASRETTDTGPCAGPDVYTDTTFGPFRTWIYTTILQRQTRPCTCPPVVLDPASRARMTALKPAIST
jgi:secreted trypsin-like serine protease